MSKPQSVKLVYFDLPGRAEVSRILLNLAGIPFEDKLIVREEWPALKATTPMGQVPILEVDGKVLAQSSAIERYAAKLGGLYPTDLWAAAKVDEAIGLIDDINGALYQTFSLPDVDAKIKARQELLAGPLKTKFEIATKLIKDSGGKYLTGNELTYADVSLYKALSGLVNGIVDGVPTDLLNSWPELKEHHNRVASLPAVAKMYEKITEGPKLSYKPLP